VCINAGITYRADNRIDVPVLIFNLLGQTDIRNIERVSLFAVAHQYIIELDISVDVCFRMNILKARDELIRE
jgi:hypothetical protein